MKRIGVLNNLAEQISTLGTVLETSHEPNALHIEHHRRVKVTLEEFLEVDKASKADNDFDNDWKKIHEYCEGYSKYCSSNPEYVATNWNGGFLPEMYPGAPQLPPGYMAKEHVSQGLQRRIQMLSFRNLEEMRIQGAPLGTPMMPSPYGGLPFGYPSNERNNLTAEYKKSLETGIDHIDSEIMRFCEGYVAFYNKVGAASSNTNPSMLRHSILPTDYPNAPKLPTGFVANDSIYAGLQRYHAHLSEKQKEGKTPGVEPPDIGDSVRTSMEQRIVDIKASLKTGIEPIDVKIEMYFDGYVLHYNNLKRAGMPTRLIDPAFLLEGLIPEAYRSSLTIHPYFLPGSNLHMSVATFKRMVKLQIGKKTGEFTAQDVTGWGELSTEDLRELFLPTEPGETIFINPEDPLDFLYKLKAKPEPKPNLLDKETYEGLGLGFPTQS